MCGNFRCGQNRRWSVRMYTSGWSLRRLLARPPLLPEGSEGEICVRGPSVFQGYLDNPRSPFIMIEGKKWYRTGDIGHFEKNGWRGNWTGFVFDYHHFHTTSHEALAVARGHITVLLGGEGGKEFKLETGDLIVLPAGTGHKMTSSSGNLIIVGAYPEGQEDYDICRSLSECPDAEEKIMNLALPVSDPFYGATGPLLKEWKPKS